MSLDEYLNAPGPDWLDLVSGQTAELRGLHADGTAYRWWPVTVESVSAAELCVIWPAGTLMDAPAEHMRATFRRTNRAIFWPARLYFITECYERDGRIGIVYADIAWTRVSGNSIQYTDHELDVVMQAGERPVVEDEDEFLLAAETFAYSDTFQEECRRALDEALTVVERWIARGMPAAFTGVKGESA